VQGKLHRRVLKQADEEGHKRVDAWGVRLVQVVDDEERRRPLLDRQQVVLNEDADSSNEPEVLCSHEGPLKGDGGGLQGSGRGAAQDLQQRCGLLQRQHG
jgi:hypothetical protein